MSRKGPLTRYLSWWRGQDLNLRPSGYEPDELPNCSTPRRDRQHSRPVSRSASRYRTAPTQAAAINCRRPTSAVERDGVLPVGEQRPQRRQQDERLVQHHVMPRVG